MRFRPPPVGRGDVPESECRLTRGGPPPPNRGHLQEAGLEQPRRQGDLEARSRVPATLVDTTFGAIADAGSIPAVSTSGSKPNSTSDVRHIARAIEPRAIVVLAERDAYGFPR